MGLGVDATGAGSNSCTSSFDAASNSADMFVFWHIKFLVYIWRSGRVLRCWSRREF
jgi:hypothetical protein